MQVRPITLKDANAFIGKFHRHHGKVVGAKFWVGLYIDEKLVGVAIAGRPVARKIDQINIIEVTRLCVIDGVKNGCSKLYSVCARIAKEMGYTKIITYILGSESGISLLAAGWLMESDSAGGGEWSSPSRPRINYEKNLFGETIKYPIQRKCRYSKILT